MYLGSIGVANNSWHRKRATIKKKAFGTNLGKVMKNFTLADLIILPFAVKKNRSVYTWVYFLLTCETSFLFYMQLRLLTDRKWKLLSEVIDSRISLIRWPCEKKNFTRKSKFYKKKWHQYSCWAWNKLS